MESQRLRFRHLTEDDIPNWVEFFDNNERLEFMGFDDSKDKNILAREWIEMQFERYKTNGLGHLAVELKETGELIGMAGILPKELDGRSEYEVAYSLKPRFWGMGYGTEMAMQIKSYGMSNLDSDRLISVIAIGNKESIHVAKKNGMKVLFRTKYAKMDVDIYGIMIK